jgi:hypothetical protein
VKIIVVDDRETILPISCNYVLYDGDQKVIAVNSILPYSDQWLVDCSKPNKDKSTQRVSFWFNTKEEAEEVACSINNILTQDLPVRINE